MKKWFVRRVLIKCTAGLGVTYKLKHKSIAKLKET
jgi:hypothetical protein